MYCKKCGKQMDDTAIFCPGCGAPTDNYVPPKAEVRQETKDSKTWPLVIGIISIALCLFILLQSCAAGLSNTIDENGDASGTLGFFVAVMYMAGGIVLIATRKSHSKIAATVLYFIGAFFGLLFDGGTFEDLAIWGGFSLIIAILCMVSTIRNRKPKTLKKPVDPNEVP